MDPGMGSSFPAPISEGWCGYSLAKMGMVWDNGAQLPHNCTLRRGSRGWCGALLLGTGPACAALCVSPWRAQAAARWELCPSWIGAWGFGDISEGSAPTAASAASPTGVGHCRDSPAFFLRMLYIEDGLSPGGTCTQCSASSQALFCRK